MFDLIQMVKAPVSADTVPPGTYVDLPGGRTFVVDVAGPPGAPVILLLHGLLATGYLNWFPAYAPLSQAFRVISMDIRGHGRGIPLDRRFRLADCADDAAALLDALGIGPAIIAGYSLGGPIAQLVWHRHRSQVAGLVLCATSRNFGGTRQERMFYSSLLGGIYGVRLARRLPRAMGGGVADRDAELKSGVVVADSDQRLSQWALQELRLTSPHAVLQAMSAMGRFSSHAWVSEIDVPTAVVVTTKDTFIAPDRQLKLARAIEGATIHPAHANHAACVIGARRFVPALVEAGLSVSGRLSVRAA